jgi:hypothetical protein
MSISIEQGTFTTNVDNHTLDLDSGLFPHAQVAPVVVANPQEPNGNFNVFISSLTVVGGSWRVTFGFSGKVGSEDVTVAYRAITRTI